MKRRPRAPGRGATRPAGDTRAFRYQLPVPGLLSAPAAFAFTSERRP